MIFLGFVFASLAAVNGQVRPIDSRPIPEYNKGRPFDSPSNGKSKTLIENRNVNIIVNVDPKDVAKELWKLIQGRLDEKQGRKPDDTRQTIKELEKIVAPMVVPTRRSSRPTPFEIGYALDHVTRRALLRDHLARPTIDDEIKTRDVVARMMFKLKAITGSEEPQYNPGDDLPIDDRQPQKNENAPYNPWDNLPIDDRQLPENQDVPYNPWDNLPIVDSQPPKMEGAQYNPWDDLPVSRRMQQSKDDQSEENDSENNDDDRYINMKLKIRRNELLKLRGTPPDV